MRFISLFFIIAFVILTAVTVKYHPVIHNPMLIEDAEFVLTDFSTDITPTVSPTVIPVGNNTVTPTTVEVPTQQQVVTPVQTQTTQTPIKITTGQTQQTPVKVTTTQPSQTKVYVEQPKQTTQKTDVTTSSNPVYNSDLIQKVMSNAEKAAQEPVVVQKPTQTAQKQVQTQQPVQTKVQEQPKTQPTTVKVETPQQTPTTTTKKVLTEEEEIIAWNIWRSNVNNYVMQNSAGKFGFVPLGTQFTFSFLVDKFGNVSNIKVECSNQDYMNEARNVVKPAIAAMQNKAILKFPEGTKRTTTQATGAFTIARSNNFYNPSDFSDYEKVKK